MGRGPRELIHTYPLQKSFNLASFFTEICDFAAFSENFKKWLHFGKIPKKFGENLTRFNKKFSKILAKSAKILKKSAKISAIFNEHFEIRERYCGFQNGAKECIV